MSPNGASPLAAPAPAQKGEHQPRWNDPAAFAATAPPPTTDEHEAAQRGGAARIERSSAPSAEPRQSGPPAAQSGRTQAQRAVAAAGLDPDQVPANAPRALAGFLVTYDSGELGSFWPIYQGRNEIGRTGAAEGLDIEIDHPTTSSRHATIVASARPARFKLEDPSSTNGTFVNDSKLENARRYELKDGDIVRFGAFSVVVKIV
jgi:pSer/pThr/pTyr-binding forkhead associated (FHA) protein